MREQAFVAFKDVRDATQAMRAESGREFFGRELKIQYARGKSDTIAKLDGTYRIPSVTAAAAGPETTATSLQQSIFNAPPGSAGITTTTVTPAAAVPLPPAVTANGAVDGEKAGSEGLQGVKRPRDESDEEEQPMEEESDVEMEASSDESG